MASEHVLNVGDTDFQASVLDSKEPVLVDFWAEWCAPCRALAPTIEELATEFAGLAKVAKLDVDSNPGISSQFGIRSIPTVLVFKNGKQVEALVGRQSKDAYAEALRRHST